MEIVNLLIGLIGIVIGILSTIIFSNQMSKGVKISSLQSIRQLINRMEEEKNKYPQESSQRLTMHHTQQELETIFKNLQQTFKIYDAPV